MRSILKNVCSIVSHTHICKQCFPLSFAVQKHDTFDTVNKKWVNFSPSTFEEVNSIISQVVGVSEVCDQNGDRGV